MATPNRKYADCRNAPGGKSCSVYISGTEDEVLKLAVRHAVNDHGFPDSPDLRQQIKGMLRDEPPGR